MVRNFLTELRKLYVIRGERFGKRYHVYRFFFTDRVKTREKRRKKKRREKKWRLHASVEFLARSVEQEGQASRHAASLRVTCPLRGGNPAAQFTRAKTPFRGIDNPMDRRSFPAREETYQRFHVDVRQIVLVREIKGFRVHLPGTRVHARLLQVTALTNRQTRAHCTCNTVFITRLDFHIFYISTRHCIFLFVQISRVT